MLPAPTSLYKQCNRGPPTRVWLGAPDQGASQGSVRAVGLTRVEINPTPSSLRLRLNKSPLPQPPHPPNTPRTARSPTPHKALEARLLDRRQGPPPEAGLHPRHPFGPRPRAVSSRSDLPLPNQTTIRFILLMRLPVQKWRRPRPYSRSSC